jgi:2-oxoglutarate dehydrogenase E1 component
MKDSETLSKQFSQLFSLNGVFVEELYNQYLEDPASVDQTWQRFFESLEEGKRFVRAPSWLHYENKILHVSRETSQETPKAKSDKVSDISGKMSSFVREYRERGHNLASIDPLGIEEIPQKEDLRLDLKSFGIYPQDMKSSVTLSSEICGIDSASVEDIVKMTEEIYSKNIGYEFSHIDNFSEKDWLKDRIENFDKENAISLEEKKEILSALVQVETFEQFLQMRFPGAKRFSIEGADNVIVATRKIIRTLVDEGVEEVVLGMPHRGRLSILTKVLNKPYKAMLSEFQGNLAHPESLDISGDVKYHLGSSSDLKFSNGKKVHMSLVANPSHLEAVNPVVVGKVRAKQDYLGDADRKKVAGVLFHGDAAFAGQGVVMESFMLSETEGYNAGGTIHVVVNNQVGFTATGKEIHKGRYTTEVAKIVKAPIFHVNGNCAEDVAKVAVIAAQYRNKYKKDVVIDLVCYRLHGHNEIDEPRFTQPTMYKKVSEQETPAKIYFDKLVGEGVVDASYYSSAKAEYKKFLDKALKDAEKYKPEKEEWFEGLWKDFMHYSEGKSEDKNTGVPAGKLQELGKKIVTIPSNIKAHKIVVRGYAKREKDIFSGENIDWATAESLAFATLVSEGTKVRLSGQDCKRGTFSQRHSVVKDQESGEEFVGLNNISKDQANFEVINSFLSEYGVMGFEYGYSITDPNALVLWEGQFGDFSNGAQIIIDQFISSAETKWMRASGLVLLLPHGYEGQGPEHSSARLERYLQLCAENNMQVVNCTTPANYFHVLRRQIHRNYRKPLIVMTPKSLLRNTAAVSSIEDFDEGTSFAPILGDGRNAHDSAKRLILCSGKVYYDLMESLSKEKKSNVAIIRIEQYYPFPEKSLLAEMKKYKKAKEVVWCQEEPRNMGAWYFIRPKIQKMMKDLKIKEELEYVGRDYSASTAAGYSSMHQRKQKEIIKNALN